MMHGIRYYGLQTTKIWKVLAASWAFHLVYSSSYVENRLIVEELTNSSSTKAISPFRNDVSTKCWMGAVSMVRNGKQDEASTNNYDLPFLSLSSGAKFCAKLDKHERQLLALQLTQCHMAESFRPMPTNCSSDETLMSEDSPLLKGCLPALSGDEFNVYTQYFLFTQHMCTRLTEELLVLQKNVIASKFEESAKKMDEKIDEAMRLQSVFLFDGIEELYDRSGINDMSSSLQPILMFVLEIGWWNFFTMWSRFIIIFLSTLILPIMLPSLRRCRNVVAYLCILEIMIENILFFTTLDTESIDDVTTFMRTWDIPLYAMICGWFTLMSKEIQSDNSNVQVEIERLRAQVEAQRIAMERERLEREQYDNNSRLLQQEEEHEEHTVVHHQHPNDFSQQMISYTDQPAPVMMPQGLHLPLPPSGPTSRRLVTIAPNGQYHDNVPIQSNYAHTTPDSCTTLNHACLQHDDYTNIDPHRYDSINQPPIHYHGAPSPPPIHYHANEDAVIPQGQSSRLDMLHDEARITISHGTKGQHDDGSKNVVTPCHKKRKRVVEQKEETAEENTGSSKKLKWDETQ